MRDYLKIYIAGITIVFIIGCSGYEKVLKSSDYKLKYSEAMRYYKEENYTRSAALFDQIAMVYRGTSQADTIYYYQAMSYFHQRDYILAGHYFRQFARTYGGSPFVEEAEFMGAYCYYLQSPRPSLDQSNTVQAIQAFQLYLIKYPESERAEKVEGYINELRNKLVEKSYMSAKLYFDLEDYKASLVALNNSLYKFPDTKYREEIMFMLVKSSYLLAYNSVRSKQKERYQDTIDEYYSFASEYPESKFMKEAQRLYKNAVDYIGDDITAQEE
jgi:outer membrane protein assembly factor BamD